MDTHAQGFTAQRRLVLAASGAVAGYALFALFEIVPDLTDRPAILAALFAGVPAFFFAFLVCLGPLSAGRAGAAATTVGLPVALLTAIASARFVDLSDMGNAAHPFLAAGLLTLVATPFALNFFDPNARWNDYPLLFRRSWEIVVRYVSAATFSGVFWALYFLSSTILSLVNLPILETFISIDSIPPILTGAVIGLALAVLFELRHLISPKIVLWLLRLLLPPIALVSLLFIILAPLNGLNSLLGDLSAGTAILAMCLSLITLITITVDRSDDHSTDALPLVIFARIGTVLVLLLAILALWAVGVRVAQYGWTPPRALAALIGAVCLAYGIAYSAALRHADGWRAALRHANIGLALGVLATTALWMTPILNAERLSANSQVKRFVAGKIPPDQFDVGKLARDWGKPGAQALAALRASDAEGLDALAEVFARLDAGELSLRPSKGPEELNAERVEALAEILPMRPEVSDPAPLIATLPSGMLGSIDWACRETKTPAGAPGCVGVVADFNGRGEELVVFYLISTGVETISRNSTYLAYDGAPLHGGLIDKILEGAFTLEPETRLMLHFDGGVTAPRLGTRPN